MPSLASAREFISRLGRRFTVSQVREAYCLTFLSPPGRHHVLPDLLEFTGALDPAPRNEDLFMQGRAAGRRDVWLRIQEHLRLTEEELFALYVGRSTFKAEDFTK